MRSAIVVDRYEYEIIMINDGSNDSSWEIIKHYAQKDNRIAGINFSRNFGYQAALSAGYKICRGNGIITMDADLQHPPSLLIDMIHTWETGIKIVYARRIMRNDSILKKYTAHIFHKLLDCISDIKIPRGISDFRLLDRQVVNELNNWTEKSRYLRGMVVWTGFSYTFLDFCQPARHNDQTKYSWSKLIKIAFDGITGFSLMPLKCSAFMGFFVITTGIAMLCFIVGESLFFHAHYPLFKWLVTIMYIFIGILFILLWIIGEYIGRIYEELKGRPLYIIKEAFNIQRRCNELDGMSTCKPQTNINRLSQNRCPSH
jgi:dolichol-phosphate mannosyltransferase